MELEKILNLFKLIPDNKLGEVVTFTCPECGGVAKAIRSEYNGHFHACCTECNFWVAE